MEYRVMEKEALLLAQRHKQMLCQLEIASLADRTDLLKQTIKDLDTEMEKTKVDIENVKKSAIIN
jgi:hypothetical protein